MQAYVGSSALAFRRVIIAATVSVALGAHLAIARPNVARQYIVTPPLWYGVSYEEASKEYKEDLTKPEYARRWEKFVLPTQSEVLLSTATHGIRNKRLTRALYEQVQWRYNGRVMIGQVPDELVKELRNTDSLPKDLRDGFGPGLPAVLEVSLGFEFQATGRSSRTALSAKDRDVETPPQSIYQPPASTDPDLPSRPATTLGRLIRPVPGQIPNRASDDQQEYDEIGRWVSDIVMKENDKAGASARSMLPLVLGEDGHKISALDLNNVDFDQLPDVVKLDLERKIEDQPERYGYASYAEFESAREKGIRLSLNPEVSVLLPYFMNGGRVSFGLGVFIRP